MVRKKISLPKPARRKPVAPAAVDLARTDRPARPLPPGPPRVASSKDLQRVLEFARRLQRGEEELDAARSVLVEDRDLRLPRLRRAQDVSDARLLRLLALLLRRAGPAIVDRAKDVAKTGVATLTPGALRTLRDVLDGNIKSTRRARLQLDAASRVLEGSGALGRGAAATQNVAVNVTLGDALRRLRDVPGGVLDVDPVDG